MRNSEDADDAHIHPNELDQETDRAGDHQVRSEDERIGPSLPPPANEHPSERHEENRLVELSRMHGHHGWRQPLRKSDAPRQIRRPAVVVAYQKAPDPAERVPDGQGGRRRCKHRKLRQPFALHHPQARQDTSGEPTEPAHATTTQKQADERLLAAVFEHPKQFRAGHPTDDPGNRGVERRLRQTRTPQFAREHPQPDQRAHREHDAEGGDVEAADSEQGRIHGLRLHVRGRVLVELCLTTRRTEVVRLAGVLALASRLALLDGHLAHGIGHHTRLL